MNDDKIKRRYAYGVVIVLIAAIAVCIAADFAVFYGIAAACVTAAVLAKKLGHSWREIGTMALSQVKNVRSICIMLLLIGGTIGLWMAGGVIGTFVYYGLKYLSGLNMVLVAFLLCSAMACILGTAMGTMSTLGIVFVGIAQALGIPMPLMAGAVVSGCYLGDRTAPLSAVYNLVSTMTGTDLAGNMKYMAKYTLAGMGLSAAFYFFMGNRYVSAAGAGDVGQLLELLSASYHISLVFMLPLALMVVLVLVFRRSIVQSLLLTLGVTVVLSFTLSGLSFQQAAGVFFQGFHPADPELARVISGSGIFSMISVILSVIFSAVLNGLMDGTRMITLLLDQLNKPAKSESRLMFNAAMTSNLLTLVTCNQPICAMATGAYFSPKFDAMHITRRSLCHLISDNGIILSPLIPWNVNAIMALSITGVSAIRYLPYTMLCLLLPLFTYFNMWRASTVNGRMGIGLFRRLNIKARLGRLKKGKE